MVPGVMLAAEAHYAAREDPMVPGVILAGQACCAALALPAMRVWLAVR